MVNENTVVIDKPFTNYQALPLYIFDFKNIIMEGDKSAKDRMTRQERQQHLKSYGLEIINHKMVYCKRCNFAMNFQIGDTLVYVKLAFFNLIFRSKKIEHILQT